MFLLYAQPTPVNRKKCKIDLNNFIKVNKDFKRIVNNGTGLDQCHFLWLFLTILKRATTLLLLLPHIPTEYSPWKIHS